MAGSKRFTPLEKKTGSTSLTGFTTDEAKKIGDTLGIDWSKPACRQAGLMLSNLGLGLMSNLSTGKGILLLM